MSKPWTEERSARAWRWVYVLLAFGALCQVFALFAGFMASR